MDRNSITGIVLIMGMLLGYQYFFAPKEEPVAITKTTSIAKKVAAVKKDTLVALVDTNAKAEQNFTLENKDIIVKLSSKGGKILSVQLKNYKSYANYAGGKREGLFLYNASKDEFSIELPLNSGKVNLANVAYTLSLIHI
jgi:YidC/Oxa1 family membrane protein insertase